MTATGPSRHRRLAFFTLVALAGTGFGPALTGARQAREPRERIVFVSVVDSQGEPVKGLTADQFVVREDGERREAVRAERATDPFDLVVLADNSSAMEPHLSDLRRSLTTLVTTMQPLGAIALVTLADRPAVAVDYTKTLGSLTRGVDRLFTQPDSGACLIDAIPEVVRGFDRRRPARPVIAAIVGDGPDMSWQTEQTALLRLAASGARFDAFVIHSAGHESPDLSSEEYRHREVLIDFATRQSGGNRVEVISSLALESRLTRYAAELANQYRVVYVRPERLIPPERIEVGVAVAGLTARATPAPVRTDR